jgi:hypothetical protein
MSNWVKQILCTNIITGDHTIAALIMDLLQAVGRSLKRLHLDSNVKNAIDSFLRDDKDDEETQATAFDEETPF